MHRKTRTAALGIVTLIIAAAIVAPTVWAQVRVDGEDLDSLVDNSDVVFPRVKVINFNGFAGRLDTTRGSVHLFSGDLRRANVRGTWRLEVPAVNGNTSGFLEIQQAAGGTFLVDLVDGDTWVLRQRASRSEWDPVGVAN